MYYLFNTSLYYCIEYSFCYRPVSIPPRVRERPSRRAFLSLFHFNFDFYLSEAMYWFSLHVKLFSRSHWMFRFFCSRFFIAWCDLNKREQQEAVKSLLRVEYTSSRFIRWYCSTTITTLSYSIDFWHICLEYCLDIYVSYYISSAFSYGKRPRQWPSLAQQRMGT